jgi:crotonobetainyl-CoA:carnitine CoA-transferase CaiB-like acyl-CoA transferase
MTGLFSLNNRGKRAITLNVKQAEGLDVLKKLIADADVFIQNFRPGAMDRLGLGYDDVKKFNPNLIYVSVSGYGPTGPNSHRRVYDNVIQAASGMAAVQTDPATGAPGMLRNLVCDKVTSYTAMQSITSALFARERGIAKGQHLTVAMLDSAVAFLWPDGGMDAALLDDDVNRTPTLGANYSVTKLSDGYCAGAAVSDAEFRGWCAALGHEAIADDPRFTSAKNRGQNMEALVSTMTKYALEANLDDFLRRAEENDVPASRVNSIADLPLDPQIVHNEVFVERSHHAAGNMREVRPAVIFSDTKLRVSRPAPMVGEHSDEIVNELGFDAAHLRSIGAIL